MVEDREPVALPHSVPARAASGVQQQYLRNYTSPFPVPIVPVLYYSSSRSIITAADILHTVL
mgnify:CR=1 FL=1